MRCCVCVVRVCEFDRATPLLVATELTVAETSHSASSSSVVTLLRGDCAFCVGLNFSAASFFFSFFLLFIICSALFVLLFAVLCPLFVLFFLFLEFSLLCFLLLPGRREQTLPEESQSCKPQHPGTVHPTATGAWRALRVG